MKIEPHDWNACALARAASVFNDAIMQDCKTRQPGSSGLQSPQPPPASKASDTRRQWEVDKREKEVRARQERARHSNIKSVGDTMCRQHAVWRCLHTHLLSRTRLRRVRAWLTPRRYKFSSVLSRRGEEMHMYGIVCIRGRWVKRKRKNNVS